MNKSIVALLMALVLCVSFMGCQKKAEEPMAPEIPAAPAEQMMPPAEAPAPEAGMPAEGTAAAPEAAAPEAAPAPEGTAH
jgi:hypothetical protein